MTTSSKGVALIEQFEGFRPTMYKDAVGLPTIGFGTLIDSQDEQWLLTATITRDQAEVLLRKDVGPVETGIGQLVKAAINQNQFDALVSFCYNLGIGNLKISTLLKKININPLDASIKDEFLKWDLAGGQALKGLEQRRQAEADLYFAPLTA